MFVIRKLKLHNIGNLGKTRFMCKKATKGEENEPQASTMKTFGQPTHDTHPYLMLPGEVTPLISKEEYVARRQKFMENINAYVAKDKSAVRNQIIVIPSASKKYMSDKIPYVFRQNSDFLYLTGCQEPDSCLVLTASSSSKFQSTLFMREKNEHSELWDGPRTGPENAPGFFGVDQSLPVDELENFLGSCYKSNKSWGLWYDYVTPVQESVHKVISSFIKNAGQKMLESPKTFIHRQRLIKSQSEIDLMQMSCDVASRAISETIRESKPGINEHAIFAKVDYECRVGGAEFLAYPPVVAGGNRANTIHYITNNQVVNDGELVLMDAGCEYHGYSSDITRTWPINGHFSPQQRDIYEVVFDVQSELIGLLANFPTLDNLFDAMCLLLGKRLQEVGLVSKNISDQALKKAAYQLCPHHVSHYLGMDVHDTPLITRNVKIQPGMIITVEPGVYINYKQTDIPKEFRGIGVRIEDDVLITENGPLVLSRNCPKSVEDVEAIASSFQPD